MRGGMTSTLLNREKAILHASKRSSSLRLTLPILETNVLPVEPCPRFWLFARITEGYNGNWNEGARQRQQLLNLTAGVFAGVHSNPTGPKPQSMGAQKQVLECG